MTTNQTGEQCRNCKWEKGDVCMLTVACSFTPRDIAPQAASAIQVGGDHYKDLAIQPAEFVHRNRIPYLEGSVIYYVTRWRTKNGLEDLRKARHTLDLMIEIEEGQTA